MERCAVRAGAIACAFSLALATSAESQALTERTPNLTGAWVAAPSALHFQFSHRFSVTGSDADITDLFGEGEITNYPTFDVALGLFEGAMAGFRYSSTSVGAGLANEWQPYVKLAPWMGTGDGTVAVALTAAWNGANQSIDGELAAELRSGRLFALAAFRGFSDIYDLPPGVPDEALAVAVGAGFKLNQYVTLTGDVADLVAGPDGELAWSAGLNFGIPFTPHTVSILATNVTSGTLSGMSAGARTFLPDGAIGPVFWGFEFTVPFSGFARWGAIFDPDELRDAPPIDDGGRRVVEIDVSSIAYRRPELEVPVGTTVRWVNKDPVAHTVTPDDEDATWGSNRIGPGEVYEHTFRREGRFSYHCVPHPFMRGVVIVRP
ncbi:MAG: plastocyanin/azurin family copper-binding protein [Gemmatimonadetes bacterium]|nr:plastocyanin/azurin family copper-binding protein [Gemmatimonadota bacterium]